MAAPSFCSLIDPLYWKYVDLNTKVKRSAICAGVRVVRSARAGVVLESLQCGLYSGVDRNVGKQ